MIAAERFWNSRTIMLPSDLFFLDWTFISVQFYSNSHYHVFWHCFCWYL